MAGRDHYCCASRVYGGTGACSNDAYRRRSQLEVALMAGIRRELLASDFLDELARRVRQRLKKRAAPDTAAEVAKLEGEIARLVDGIASGALSASPAIAERLKDSEAKLAQLKSRRGSSKPVERLLPELAQRCRRSIENLEHTLSKDATRARVKSRWQRGRATTGYYYTRAVRPHSLPRPGGP